MGFPWLSSGSLDGFSEHLSCLQELWLLPWLFYRSTALQCSGCFVPVLLLVWRGLFGCFCFLGRTLVLIYVFISPWL